MGQFVDFEDDHRTILEELMTRSELGETAARNLLARFGFRDIDVYKEISVLSGGERSRVYLCCLLEEKPEMLFLDEPTNHLDIESREVLEDALASYNGAILAVSHDRYFIEKCESQILGFIGDRVTIYDRYDYYRRAYKEYLDSMSSASKKDAKSSSSSSSDSGKKASSTKTSAPTMNRAQERKEIAKRKERIRFIEKRTAELEEAQKALEASFGANTPPEDYDTYARNSEELEALYEEYMELESE